MSPSWLSLQPTFLHACYLIWVPPSQLSQGWEGLLGWGEMGNILLNPTCPIDTVQEEVTMWPEYTFVGDLAWALFKTAVLKVSFTCFYLAFF